MWNKLRAPLRGALNAGQTRQEVKAGQLIGLVRFGSQVAVYLPKDAVRVIVKEGQKVQGGNTVLALWK